MGLPPPHRANSRRLTLARFHASHARNLLHGQRLWSTCDAQTTAAANTQLWFCVDCGERGDVFKLIRLLDGAGVPKSRRCLALHMRPDARARMYAHARVGRRGRVPRDGRLPWEDARRRHTRDSGRVRAHPASRGCVLPPRLPFHSHPRQSAVGGLALAPLPIPIPILCVDSSGLWRQAPIVEHVLVEDPSMQCGSPQLTSMDYTSAMHLRKDRL